MKKYLVYEIKYHGALPEIKDKRYIGRVTREKWEEGYLGTPTSKKYSKIWGDACKYTPKMFSRKILFETNDLLENNEMEEQIQRERNVVLSDDYINLAYANRNFDNTGRVHSKETKRKMSGSAKNRPPDTEETKKKKGDANRGKAFTEETKKNMSVSAITRYEDPKEREKQSVRMTKWWAERKAKVNSNEH